MVSVVHSGCWIMSEATLQGEICQISIKSERFPHMQCDMLAKSMAQIVLDR